MIIRTKFAAQNADRVIYRTRHENNSIMSNKYRNKCIKTLFLQLANGMIFIKTLFR